MVIHLKPEGMPLSVKEWARYSGALYKTFRDRLKQVRRFAGAQRKQRAPSTEADKAEEAAREAMLKAIRETRVAEEEREAELVRLRENIMLRWYASDECRKMKRLDKRHHKKTRH